MQSTTTSTKNILLISPDEDILNTMRTSIANINFNPVVARGHLHALGLLDEIQFEVIVSTVETTDIDGFEFTNLVRNREKKDFYPENYIILFGRDKHRDLIISSNQEIDDFIIYPFYESELIWRIKRGMAIKERIRTLEEKLIYDPFSQTLTPEGFLLSLKNEINRSLRHNGTFSLLAIRLKYNDFMVISFGEGWKMWLEKSFVSHLKNRLRNYDKLSNFKDNIYLLLAPDTDYNGLQGLDKRLRKEYSLFFQEVEEMGIEAQIQIIHCGLAVEMDVSVDYKENVYNHLYHWIEAHIQGECEEDYLVRGILTEEGLDYTVD